MRIVDRLFRSSWGTLRFGDTYVPVRLVVFVAGVTLWIGLMLIETGARGLSTLWQVVLFLLALAIVSSPTRTVSVQRLSTCFFAGGVLMGVMLLFSRLFEIVEPNQLAPIRDFVIPPTEEILKLVPVAVVLWRGRKTEAWALGATNALLIVLLTAAGFGLVENAYLAAHSHPRHDASMIPFTGGEDFGRAVADALTIKSSGAYNVASGDFRYRDLILLINRLAWMKPGFMIRPDTRPQTGEFRVYQSRFFLDTTAFRAATGWQPRQTLEELVEAFIRAERDASSAKGASA